MTVHNPFFGRAFDLKRMAINDRPTARRTVEGLRQAIAARAFKSGVNLYEDDGDIVSVQPKWLMGVIAEFCENPHCKSHYISLNILWGTGTHRLTEETPIRVTRKHIKSMQAYGDD